MSIRAICCGKKRKPTQLNLHNGYDGGSFTCKSGFGCKKPEKDQTLENFMKEFFPFKEFMKAGIFTKEMRGDYKAQAERICNRLGLKSIYEYGKDEIRCHISYGDRVLDSRIPLSVDEDGELKSDFITVVPSIYE